MFFCCWEFGVFSFLETPVLRFALLPYYQRFMFSLDDWTWESMPMFRCCRVVQGGKLNVTEKFVDGKLQTEHFFKK